MTINKIDVTAPGKKAKKGNLHAITKAIREIEDLFSRLGFDVISGPEVESEFFNFDAMNVPLNHPARDMQDTFFIKNKNVKSVLRTHTSGVQARYMIDKTPPFRVIVPGRVFRNESADATHEAQFHQFEGLMVGENISLANLRGVLSQFFREFFDNENINIRLRPAFFPFVEPGLEYDITCHRCKNNPVKTCNVCKGSGWIEIGGAGMVHPNVLKAVNIDNKKYQGFAFGMGIERMVMLKYGVDDIRDFYDGEIPFLKQF